ncbi:hypothetical protein PN836_012865 [Ningiella sp. W23]|uniref:hypothetical protein n=1 Tax=Ningiella sp. W23 TaxID=3023715 RepID=UPI003757724E
MIPNLDQLLIVCGIALAFVAGITWLLLKLPEHDDGDINDNQANSVQSDTQASKNDESAP